MRMMIKWLYDTMYVQSIWNFSTTIQVMKLNRDLSTDRWPINSFHVWYPDTRSIWQTHNNNTGQKVILNNLYIQRTLSTNTTRPQVIGADDAQFNTHCNRLFILLTRIETNLDVAEFRPLKTFLIRSIKVVTMWI